MTTITTDQLIKQMESLINLYKTGHYNIYDIDHRFISGVLIKDHISRLPFSSKCNNSTELRNKQQKLLHTWVQYTVYYGMVVTMNIPDSRKVMMKDNIIRDLRSIKDTVDCEDILQLVMSGDIYNLEYDDLVKLTMNHIDNIVQLIIDRDLPHFRDMYNNTNYSSKVKRSLSEEDRIKIREQLLSEPRFIVLKDSFPGLLPGVIYDKDLNEVVDTTRGNNE